MAGTGGEHQVDTFDGPRCTGERVRSHGTQRASLPDVPDRLKSAGTLHNRTGARAVQRVVSTLEEAPAATVEPVPTTSRLSQRHPWLFPWAVRAHQVRRHVQWLRPGTSWARDHVDADLPVRVKQHGSLLMRELSAEEMVLQRGKVVNLRLASARTDGLLVRPGETFSFNKVVGSCTRRRGYVEGMRLSNGEAVSGVGGGICQLANLVHWMVLHSPLTVVERSEHSFDPFPDKGRVLPWGVGCSIVYNYVDLVVRNDTTATFQLRTWVGERHLRGELRSDRPTSTSYRVEARDEEFVAVGRGRVPAQRDLADVDRQAHRRHRRRGAGQAQLRAGEVRPRPRARAPRARRPLTRPTCQAGHRRPAPHVRRVTDPSHMSGGSPTRRTCGAGRWVRAGTRRPGPGARRRPGGPGS